MATDPSAARDMCFVLMPFGNKPDRSGRTIQFDDIYRELVAPAIEAAGLTPLRSDEELRGGFIHKQMFERLLLCPFAVADLSTANANVYYEVGVRHATRPHTTVLIFSDESDLRFDIQPLRSLHYGLDEFGRLSDAASDRDHLATRLREAQSPRSDSPLFELFHDHYRPPELAHEVCDTFHEKVQYSETAKLKLRNLRARYAKTQRGAHEEQQVIRDELAAYHDELRGHRYTEAGTLVAVLLTYRACEDHAAMIRMVESLDEPLRGHKVVQEALGFALNRQERRSEACEVLEDVVRRFGANPESCGLLGRVHQDSWEDARASGNTDEAAHALDQAIATYLRGYDSDIRDYYPGINAVTLMDFKGDSRRDDLLPVVRYAVERRLANLPEERHEYWEYATLLELAILEGDREAARTARSAARRHPRRERWFFATTAKNLELIAEQRERAGRTDDANWIRSEIAELQA